MSDLRNKLGALGAMLREGSKQDAPHDWHGYTPDGIWHGCPEHPNAQAFVDAALLYKLAESWIDTGLHGTGLRKDEYVEQHKEAIQGIYETCGKSLLEYLNYALRQAIQQAEGESK